MSGRSPIWDIMSRIKRSAMFLRRHGIPPAPERKRRTTWAEFIRIHLALLVGTGICTAGVLIRGLLTHCALFFISLESSRINISRITSNKPWKLPVSRNVRIRRRGTRQRCYALHDRDTIYFTSFQATRAPPTRSLSVGAESSMVEPQRTSVCQKSSLSAIAHRRERRRAILNEIIMENPPSYCCAADCGNAPRRGSTMPRAVG